MGGRRSSINAYTPFQASWPIVSHSALCLHHGFVHGSIHLFVALPISMVQEGLRKRLILPGGQYPDHVLHSFAGPAPPLPFHAIAVEPVIRFCSTQVDFCMDAALALAWDIGSISFQIALLFVYLLQIRLCMGMAGEKESIDKIIAEHSAGSLSYKDAGTTSQNNSAITIDSLPNALGIVKKDAYHQMAGEHARNAPLDKSEFSLHGKWNRTVRNSFSGEGGGNKKRNSKLRSPGARFKK